MTWKDVVEEIYRRHPEYKDEPMFDPLKWIEDNTEEYIEISDFLKSVDEKDGLTEQIADRVIEHLNKKEF